MKCKVTSITVIQLTVIQLNLLVLYVMWSWLKGIVRYIKIINNYFCNISVLT